MGAGEHWHGPWGKQERLGKEEEDKFDVNAMLGACLVGWGEMGFQDQEARCGSWELEGGQADCRSDREGTCGGVGIV